MFYLVYKITNTINGKFYIGCHKTYNLNDGYFGSGKILKLAVTKYGIENFVKEIIYEASTSEEMFQKEKELVQIGKHSYNLKLGGQGGFDFINENMSKEERSRISKIGSNALKNKLKNDIEFLNKSLFSPFSMFPRFTSYLRSLVHPFTSFNPLLFKPLR